MSNNFFESVATINEAGLGYLLNSMPVVSNANGKFKDWDKITSYNKGDTVQYEEPTRFSSGSGLSVTFQSIQQRVRQLTVDQAAHVAYEVTNQEYIFNAREYVKKYSLFSLKELATGVEANVSRLFETHPYRFVGDGVTPLNSYVQLAKYVRQFANFGISDNKIKGYFDDLTEPGIVNSGQNQFTPERNNKTAMSWDVGYAAGADWYSSNLLPVHNAGTEGDAGSTLTVVSTTKNADGAITAITFSGTDAASDANSVKEHDSFVFSDGIAGFPTNLRFLTWNGRHVSSSPVQFRATSDAASTAGSQVTVSVYPFLYPGTTIVANSININQDIVAGMQATVLPTHRCGCIMAGDPLYVAMPRLPDEVPYPTARTVDQQTGISMRSSYGSQWGEGRQGFKHDLIWGSDLAPDYSIKIALPV